MSNLYKNSYVVSTNTQKRIINYNSIIQERINAGSNSGGLRFQSFDDDKEISEDLEDGFLAGIEAETVEVEPEITREEILEKANQEVEEILLNAHREAESIRMQAQSEAASLEEQARQKGYEEGGAQKEQELTERRNQLEQEFLEKKQLLEEQYLQKQNEMETDIVVAITSVIERVFHVQFQDSKEIILNLIQRTLMNVEIGKSFRIRVSEHNRSYIEENMERLREQVGGEITIEVSADISLDDEQCLLETDFGVFDCGMDTQLKNLMKEIQRLSK